jgi:hypothetical protein
MPADNGPDQPAIPSERRWTTSIPPTPDLPPPTSTVTAAKTIPEGAAEVIRLALLFDDGPAATYSNRKGIVRW